MYADNEVVTTTSPKYPFVYMLVGLPASGKSTFRGTLALPYASSDYYIEQWAKERNQTYSEIFREVVGDAHNAMMRDVAFFNEGGGAWIWDQTNLTPKARKDKLALIDDKFYKIAVFFDTPLEVCLQRNQERERSIPEDVIIQMSNKLTKPATSEGFNEIRVFDQTGKITEVDFKIGV